MSRPRRTPVRRARVVREQACRRAVGESRVTDFERLSRGTWGGRRRAWRWLNDSGKRRVRVAFLWWGPASGPTGVPYRARSPPPPPPPVTPLLSKPPSHHPPRRGPSLATSPRPVVDDSSQPSMTSRTWEGGACSMSITGRSLFPTSPPPLAAAPLLRLTHTDPCSPGP